MAAYLIDHPPARSQYRAPRREDPSGVVGVHSAENTPDFVAFDGGAEAVARFIEGRDTPGSYHDLCDSDSCINLVDYGHEAFHDGTGTNPHSYGLSVATRADVWPFAPKAWRDGAVEQAAQAAARYARWFHARTGRWIPAKRITATQARARVPGFISHAELDPTRRTDPGAGFPWDQFLARYGQLIAQPSQEDPDMAIAVKSEDDDRWWAITAIGRRHLVNRKDAAEEAYLGLLKVKSGNSPETLEPFIWPQKLIDKRPRTDVVA